MKHSCLTSDRFHQKLTSRALKPKTLKVLAVDDDPTILEILETSLVAFGNCELVTASDAKAALRAIKCAKDPFDCLLLDIQMPNINGIELLRNIRALEGYDHTPVIMLTAMRDRQYIDQAFLEGATDYLTKPFDLLELRSRIRVAHRLLHDRLKSKQTLESARTLQKELDFTQHFNFEDPLVLEGLSRCLRYIEFDNYVRQLSFGRLFDSYATAIKIQDAEYYFDLSTSGDFRRAISDLGYSIEKMTSSAEAVFSYRGGGVFLVVTRGRERTCSVSSEQHLNQIFDKILGNRREANWLRALVGEPVCVRALTAGGVLSSLSKAIKNVNTRETYLQKYTDPQDELANLEPEQREKARRRGYERVMLQLFGDDNHFFG